MAKYYVTEKYSVEEAYDIVKSNIKNTNVVSMVKNMNSFDIISNWGKLTISIQGDTIMISQGWNNEKLPFVIMFIVLGLFLWVIIIAFIVLSCLEVNKLKEIEKEVLNIL